MKHLPPSSSRLRLLDIGANTETIISAARPDVEIITASMRVEDWRYSENSLDAVVGYDLLVTDALLQQTLWVMRPGGRMIVVNPTGSVEQSIVEKLESAGFVRILVEEATGAGVLIRGEKAHITDDTHARIEAVAAQDEQGISLDGYRGRFLYLLVRQSPNKPVWKLTAEDQIRWEAYGIRQNGGFTALAFTSLPKAVAFMQRVVMDGKIKDVNKVPKLKRENVVLWNESVLLNCDPALVQISTLLLNHIDPALAELPDE
jgi:hypothetical protein